MKRALLLLAAFLLLPTGGALYAQAADRIQRATVAQMAALTPAEARQRRIYTCVDCLTDSTCTTGGGSADPLCKWNGSAWEPVSGSGSVTQVWTQTGPDISALTAASGDTLDAGSADSIAPSTRSTSLPASCTEGWFHQDTDSGGSEVYVCTATNTWTKLGATTFSAQFYWTASKLESLNHDTDAIASVSRVSGTNVDRLVRLYDATTDECASQSLRVPTDVTSGSTITFRAYWFSATQTTGDVVWDIRHSNGQAEGETWDQGLTTETAAADTTQGTVNQITATGWTETLANTGWAAGEFVSFEVCRDANAGGDTMTGDASLLAFAIEVPRG